MAFAFKESDIKVAIITAVLSIGLTVSVLHMKGYIKHSTPQDAAVVETFKLISLKPGYEQVISSKKAEKAAFCSQGYLLVRSRVKQDIGGILVDDRNRAIPCLESLEEPINR